MTPLELVTDRGPCAVTLVQLGWGWVVLSEWSGEPFIAGGFDYCVGVLREMAGLVIRP